MSRHRPWTRSRSLVPVLGAVAAAASMALSAVPTQAAPMSETSRPLRWQVDPDGDGLIKVGQYVKGSSVKLHRDKDGVSFEIQTSGLVKGHAYNVWFWSFDNPKMCVTGEATPGSRCTLYDLAFNPAAQGSLMWGRTGRFVNASGITRFDGRRDRNPLPCLTEPAVVTKDCGGVLLGRGLQNPLTAEIHLVVRDHGPDQPEIKDETTTLHGGCDRADNDHGIPPLPGWGTPGSYPCRDIQNTAVAPRIPGS